jgi:acetate kinase
MILTINTGSSSIKFALFEVKGAATVVQVAEGMVDFAKEQVKQPPSLEAQSADSGIVHLFQKRFEQLCHSLKEAVALDQVRYVAHRVVHGGDHFTQATVLDSANMKQMKALIALAPLHQPHCLEGINQLRQLLPKAIHLACFDTAFHQTIPAVRRQFALTKQLTEKGIRPYGFHGLSYQYVASELKKLMVSSGQEQHDYRPNRAIVAHLGSGASLCGMLDGHSVATSMTFSPLDGLMMGSRCGSIDANAVLFMIDNLGMSTSQVSDLLNNQSGLLAVSQLSADMRKLMSSDSQSAQFAIEMFVDRVIKEVGGIMALLGGVDCLVFTGGIGYHNRLIRQKICQKLSWLHLIDEIKINDHPSREQSHQIKQAFHVSSDKEQAVAVLAMETDEQKCMAKQVVDKITKESHDESI